MPAAERSQFSLELLTEVLAETRAMRRSLRVLGLDTPGLDAEVAALEGAIAAARGRSDFSMCDEATTEHASPRISAALASDATRIDGSSAHGWRADNMAGTAKKLTPELVAKIRALGKLAAAGVTSQHAIAAHFRLSQSTVSNIIAGNLWPICPTTEWKPQLQLVDPNKVDAMAQRFGGRFAGPGGVVTLPASDDSTSLPGTDDVGAVSDDTTEIEDCAQ